MNIIEVVWIAIGLAMDAFAVAIACSIALQSVSPRQVFRIAFHFGLFQGIMPILGWSAGLSARGFIASWDHWVAFGLLAFIGGRAILESLKKDSSNLKESDPTKGIMLVGFSLATSIDALAVGVSLAAVNVAIWQPAVIIGIVTLALSTLGMLFGNKLGTRLGHRVEMLGGIILVGIGLKILLSHTVFA
jgi:manganese efflux pump family protein